MKCNWCERPNTNPITTGGGFRYCSRKCEIRATQYTTNRMEAALAGEEIPSRKEYQELWERAGRWTPDKMQERVRELEQAARDYEGPLYERHYTVISDPRG